MSCPTFLHRSFEKTHFCQVQRIRSMLSLAEPRRVDRYLIMVKIRAKTYMETILMLILSSSMCNSECFTSKWFSKLDCRPTQYLIYHIPVLDSFISSARNLIWAVIGAGFHATPNCAASCSGTGEQIITHG